MIAGLVEEGYSAKLCCRLLGVAPSGFFRWKRQGPTAAELRRAWLTELIADIVHSSRGTYGRRRVRAELVIGRGIPVNKKLIASIMSENAWQGLPVHRKPRRTEHEATSQDLVKRAFDRDESNRLWMTDITEHPTREGKVYCCVVLDAHSRRVVGWSIDSTQTSALVTNALGMALDNRRPSPGCVVHSDRGSQFTPWVFSQKVREAGCMPSMGRVGTAYDNAVIESFWARMQTEFLDRQKWRTRVQLSSAIFEYLEIFYNRQRRHSSLGMLSPVEFERDIASVA